jgi:hypothetical protein
MYFALEDLQRTAAFIEEDWPHHLRKKKKEKLHSSLLHEQTNAKVCYPAPIIIIFNTFIAHYLRKSSKRFTFTCTPIYTHELATPRICD